MMRLRLCRTLFLRVTVCLGGLIAIWIFSQWPNERVPAAYEEKNGLSKEFKAKMPTATPRQPAAEVFHPRVTLVPKVAYVLWCDNTTFNFVNYISLLSILHFMRPEKLVLQYRHLPLVDRYFYNTWFAELRDSVAVLTLEDIGGVKGACSGEGSRARFMRATVARDGGVYVGCRTIFLRELAELNSDHVNHLRSSREGYAASKADNAAVDFGRPTTVCVATGSRPTALPANASCVYESREIYPKDFWQRTDRYGATVRLLMYGSEEVPTPASNADNLIPNIAHIMWLYGRPVDFLFYLCCLSLLYVVDVDRLYVHGDVPPSGDYWAKLAVNDRVTFIRRVVPAHAYGQRAGGVHLISDIFRSEIMVEYGGVYSDVDVIWTQPLDRRIRSYDAVASRDWANAYQPYPNYINLGVSIGKRNAPFWRLFRASLKNLRPSIFGFNGLLQPYKIYERNPRTLHLDDHFQVMCFRANCFPLWGEPYTSIDWRRQTHAFHWTWPTPAEFADRRALLDSRSVWAQIGQHVLRKAGLL